MSVAQDRKHIENNAARVADVLAVPPAPGCGRQRSERDAALCKQREVLISLGWLRASLYGKHPIKRWSVPAIKRLQKAVGVKGDGDWGPKTNNALKNVVQNALQQSIDVSQAEKAGKAPAPRPRPGPAPGPTPPAPPKPPKPPIMAGMFAGPMGKLMLFSMIGGLAYLGLKKLGVLKDVPPSEAFGEMDEGPQLDAMPEMPEELGEGTDPEVAQVLAAVNGIPGFR